MSYDNVVGMPPPGGIALGAQAAAMQKAQKFSDAGQRLYFVATLAQAAQTFKAAGYDDGAAAAVAVAKKILAKVEV